MNIPVPTRFQTPELFAVAPGVWGLRDVFVNLYFVRADEDSLAWVLIDAGLPGSTDKVRDAARQLFGAEVPPAAILLTHGHFDHVGTLQSAFPQVPVYAHELELPYLTGRSSYPPPDPVVGGGAMAWMSFLYPRSPLNLGTRVRALSADGTVPDLAGWRWVFTPGHTPGHVSFLRESDRLLLAGDAITTVKGESAYRTFTQTPELHGPPAYFTPDWDAARTSVRTLAGLDIATAATGHGVPLHGPALRQALDELARDFDQVARPAKGRYVREPAIADEHGVKHVPPPVGLPTAAYVAVGALLAAVGVVAWQRSRKQGQIAAVPKPRRRSGERAKNAGLWAKERRHPEAQPSLFDVEPHTPELTPDRGYGGMAVSRGSAPDVPAWQAE